MADQSKKKHAGLKRRLNCHTAIQVDIIPDVVEEILPQETNMWETVLLRCSNKDPGYVPNDDFSKAKFHKMDFIIKNKNSER